MSREILDCLKRQRNICVKNVTPSQNTAFMFTPALRFRNPPRERAPSVSRQKPSFGDAEHSTLDFEHFAFVFCPNYLFSAFNIWCHTSVFYTVDIYVRILRKIIFNNLFILMHVVRKHGEDVFETFALVSLIQKKQTIIPTSYTPDPLQLVFITKKGLFLNFFSSNSHSFGGGSPKESKDSCSPCFAR